MVKKHIAKTGKDAGKWVTCSAEQNCRNGGAHADSSLLKETKQFMETKMGVVVPLKEVKINMVNAYQLSVIYGDSDKKGNVPGVEYKTVPVEVELCSKRALDGEDLKIIADSNRTLEYVASTSEIISGGGHSIAKVLPDGRLCEYESRDGFMQVKAAHIPGTKTYKDWQSQLVKKFYVPEAEQFRLGEKVDSEKTFDSSSPAVQSGAIVDKVEHDGVVYHRRRDEIFADAPYSIRVQANRKLSESDTGRLAGLIGYNYRVSIRGESLGNPVNDSPYSFVVAADSTKSQRDDLGEGFDDFENSVGDLVKRGSPVRKTDRGGAGTKGTRAIDGFGDDFKVEIFYDNVSEF